MKRLVTKMKTLTVLFFFISLSSCATTDEMKGEETIDEASLLGDANESLDEFSAETPEIDGVQEVESLSESFEQTSDILEGGEASVPEMEEVASETFSEESYELAETNDSGLSGLDLGADADEQADQEALASEMNTVGSIESIESAVNEASSIISGDDSYIVQPGDTLSKIASVVYGDASKWKELASDNAIAGTKIFPGDELKLRSDDATAYTSAMANMTKRTVTVQAGDSLASIAQVVLGDSMYWKVLYKYNKDKISNPNRIYAGQVLVYYEKSDLRAALDGIHGSTTGATAH